MSTNLGKDVLTLPDDKYEELERLSALGYSEADMAMYFDVPVVAYDSSAIAGTLGGGGFLLKDKNPVETAGGINRVVTDEALRTQIIKNQQARLADFDHKVIEAQFKTYLDTFINGGRKG